MANWSCTHLVVSFSRSNGTFGFLTSTHGILSFVALGHQCLPSFQSCLLLYIPLFLNSVVPLKTYSDSGKNLSIFSDCDSAIKKVGRLLSLSVSLSVSSMHLSSLDHRMMSVIRHIHGQGHSITLHWVKAHSGIIQLPRKRLKTRREKRCLKRCRRRSGS